MRTSSYEVEADALALLGVMKKHEELEIPPPHYPVAHAFRITSSRARRPGPDNTTLRVGCEVSGEEWVLMWEGHLGSVPRVGLYRITQRGPRFLEEA
jgi:hypothetical protein